MLLFFVLSCSDCFQVRKRLHTLFKNLATILPFAPKRSIAVVSWERNTTGAVMT